MCQPTVALQQRNVAIYPFSPDEFPKCSSLFNHIDRDALALLALLAALLMLMLMLVVLLAFGLGLSPWIKLNDPRLRSEMSRGIDAASPSSRRRKTGPSSFALPCWMLEARMLNAIAPMGVRRLNIFIIFYFRYAGRRNVSTLVCVEAKSASVGCKSQRRLFVVRAVYVETSI